jgi:hypothetical protein
MDEVAINFRGARVIARTMESTSPHLQGRYLLILPPPLPESSTIYHHCTLTLAVDQAFNYAPALP